MSETKDSVSSGTLSDEVFEVEMPEVLNPQVPLQESSPEDPVGRDNWYKVKGWYNELSFYSKVFQFFVEGIKETESQYGWWIIVISSVTSFITLSTLDPFDLSEQNTIYYNWTKNLVVSVMTIVTTLIAAWTKKKGYVKRMQAVDKRIARLEKFLGVLDYQMRLVPRDQREDYLTFIARMKDEHSELAVYSNLISPSEFTKTVYVITRYNAPLVSGAWPWYDTVTERPTPNFARHIIETYEDKYSWKGWCRSLWCCCWGADLTTNPLVTETA